VKFFTPGLKSITPKALAIQFGGSPSPAHQEAGPGALNANAKNAAKPSRPNATR